MRIIKIFCTAFLLVALLAGCRKEGGAETFTLRNENGMTATFTSYGARLLRLEVPARDGSLKNVVWGCRDAEEALTDSDYRQPIVGRYGNRIAKGSFELDGYTYQLSVNEGENHLHGGKKGFDKQEWTLQPLADNVLLMTRVSPDGGIFVLENNSLPGFTDYSMKNRTYRYMVEDPLYPFGYGLSYTTFEQSIKEIRRNGSAVSGTAEFAEGDTLEIDVELKNTGKYEGGVTVQAYIEYGFDDAPVRQLKGLKKLYLAPGESRKTTIKLDTSSFSLFDKDGVSKLNKGSYKVFLGDSQPDELSRRLTGRKCDLVAVEVK